MAYSAIRFYFKLLKMSIKAQLRQPIALWLMFFSHFAATSIDLIGIAILFHRFHAIGSWRLEEVALLYGVVHMAFAIAECLSRGFDQFSWQIKSGQFDRLLLRPRSAPLQVAAIEIQLLRLGRFLQGFLVLNYAIYSLSLNLGPAQILLLFSAVIGAACLFYSLFVLQAALSFWTVESLEMMHVFTYGGVETAQYPIFIYQDWLKRFFIFIVPLASITYFPISYLLQKEANLLYPFLPALGPAFLWLAFKVWAIGQRRYTSAGS
ncbi:MAG: transporter permease [Chlamydiales bacterium]|jgi:ABC-2 type transport system permease protein|nr:transporter permease [Chlamydiales bacterium]